MNIQEANLVRLLNRVPEQDQGGLFQIKAKGKERVWPELLSVIGMVGLISSLAGAVFMHQGAGRLVHFELGNNTFAVVVNENHHPVDVRFVDEGRTATYVAGPGLSTIEYPGIGTDYWSITNYSGQVSRESLTIASR